jgi:hypothetical protein
MARPTKARENERAAAIYLEHLLTTVNEYRDQWTGQLRWVPKPSREGAIARVILEWMSDAGEGNGTENERGMETRVRRALKGSPLSYETLYFFGRAFGVAPGHWDQLDATYKGEISRSGRIPPVVVGDEILNANEARLKYEVRSVFERHFVGANGRPQEHSTLQQLKSLQDGLSVYPYVFDTNEVSIQIFRGASLSDALTPYQDSKTLFQAELVFDRPADRGEMVSFEYITKFRYRKRPEPQFLRQCRRPVTNLDIVVQFDRTCLPTEISWIGGNLTKPEDEQSIQVELDHQHAVHCLHEYVAGAFVGFRWSF